MHVSVRRRATAVSVLALSVLAVSACSGGSTDEQGSDASPASSEQSAGTTTDDGDAAEAADVAPAKVTTNVRDGASAVAVDTEVALDVADGTLAKVVLTGGDDKVPGSMSKGDTAWSADELLESGTSYTLLTTTLDAAGGRTSEKTRFSTPDLSLPQQTYPSITPLEGDTVGVAMPIIIHFDIPVTNKKAMEKQLSVESTPAVQGAWSWISDTDVHYRPKSYWPSGAEVTVNADVNSVKAGPNLWGQESRSTSFTVGDRVTSTVDVAAHTLTVKVDGDVVRTLPVTTGGPGFETRAGTKVIKEKYLEKRMDAATTGVSPDSPDYYNIPDVQYAMRVTDTGEFVHAAPWSVGSQGSENVSHGCVGMSTEDAEWFYNLSSIGDPITFVNSPRSLEDNNGWTDWNESFKEFKQDSLA